MCKRKRNILQFTYDIEDGRFTEIYLLIEKKIKILK